MKTHKEEWYDFGANIKNYIENNKVDLEIKSYDVILSFSRGGTILAFVFSCLLKDNLIEYSKSYKASVRAIPNGIVVKKNDPCFVMNQPTSDQEKQDLLGNLVAELQSFSEKNKMGKPLSILAIDDNLTGATRLKYLDSLLTQIENKNPRLVEYHQMLGYVRHNKFNILEIPTMISFPEHVDIFVMPWHNPHPKTAELDIENTNSVIEEVIFCIKLNCKFGSFIENVKIKCGTDYEYFDDSRIIRNGATIFYINDSKHSEQKFVDIYCKFNMIYPPKMCLRTAISNEDVSDSNKEDKFNMICDYCDCKTIDVCNICIYLNCNKKLIENVFMASANCNDLSITLKFHEGTAANNDEQQILFKNKLENGIRSWLRNRLTKT